MRDLEIPQKKENPFQPLKTRLYIVNPWFLLLIFILAYVALDFVSMAGEDFLITHLGQNKLSWKGYLLVSLALLGVLYVITKLTRIPLIDFEQI